jgi:methionine-rich copper-binding protein CopC
MDSAAQSAMSRRDAVVGALLATAGLLLCRTEVGAHAFLKRSEPRAGAMVEAPPRQIRIWFDGPVEPLLLMIRVEDRDQRRADKGDGRVNPEDSTLVEVGVPPLPSGRYTVFYSVVARDGHRKEGDFRFRVK